MIEREVDRTPFDPWGGAPACPEGAPEVIAAETPYGSGHLGYRCRSDGVNRGFRSGSASTGTPDPYDDVSDCLPTNYVN